MNPGISIADIDALLPQTQCRDCGYQGCRPYAQAIIEKNESLDRCLPGGVATLQALGNLCQQPIDELISGMQVKQKPRQVAIIREDICIGCTKCIAACPVDAILGTAKHMHTIISDECTGCELCVAPCPVDCIDIMELSPALTALETAEKAQHYRMRYTEHTTRLAKQRHKKPPKKSVVDTAKTGDAAAKQAIIAAALQRVQAKKLIDKSKMDCNDE